MNRIGKIRESEKEKKILRVERRVAKLKMSISDRLKRLQSI
jgi:hypothetical protein